MRLTDLAKLYVMAFLMLVVFFVAISVPAIPDTPPLKWMISFGLTCLAFGVVIGFGIRGFLLPKEEE